MKFKHLILLAAVIVPVSYAGKSVNAALSFAQTVVQDGAITYWQLNDANTTSGATAVSTVNPGIYNGKYQSGSLTGGVTTGAAPFPAMGTAAFFHNTTANTTLATSDAVIAPATGLPAGDADRTMIFWEKDSLTGTPGYYQIQADYGKPGPLNGGNFNGSFIPTIYPNATGQGFTNYGSTINTNTPAINDGDWHFIAITADSTLQAAGSTLYSVYVDGNVTPVATEIFTQNTVPDQMTIGSATVVDVGGGGVIGWNGGLSNLAVFNSVLTSGPNGQIQTLYANAANVPEPVSLSLMSLAAIGLITRRRCN